MSSLTEIADALATQIDDYLAGLDSSYGELQVEPRRIFNPTPPAIDIYPADAVAQEQTSFGYAGRDAFLTIRARVTMADEDAGQDLLLELADTGATSIMAALASDKTLGGTVDAHAVESQSGFRVYEDVPGTAAYLGCEWTIRVVRS
jgi:hypothetical protein